MRPALFLDRDGVIIENRADYVLNWPDVSFYPQALTALTQVSRTPYRIVVVTNQSAVGRGLISLETAQEINQRIVEKVEQAGGRIDKVYMCPHAPSEDCDCRKPKPGLFHQAQEELSLDLGQSIMIGDALTDLIAAKAAGIDRLGLVLTGRGAAQALLPEAVQLAPLSIYNHLQASLEKLIPSIEK